MKKSNHFLKRSACVCLLFFFSCSACFSETVFQIKESELTRIQQETENLTKIVSEQNSQLLQLQKLSSELRTEAESERKKAQLYKGIAIGACASSIILAGALIFTRK